MAFEPRWAAAIEMRGKLCKHTQRENDSCIKRNCGVHLEPGDLEPGEYVSDVESSDRSSGLGGPESA